MATHVILIKLTEEGAAEVDHLSVWIGDAQAVAVKLGGSVTDWAITMGAYDGVVSCEFPDESSAARFSTHLCLRGKFRTTTMRAYARQEWMVQVANLLPQFHTHHHEPFDARLVGSEATRDAEPPEGEAKG
jgi:uncharacterized protein with GYD domain